MKKKLRKITFKNSVWRLTKKFLAFWQKLSGRVVKTPFYKYRKKFQRKAVFFFKKTIFLSLFGVSMLHSTCPDEELEEKSFLKEFSVTNFQLSAKNLRPPEKCFGQFCQNCFLRVQLNISVKNLWKLFFAIIRGLWVKLLAFFREFRLRSCQNRILHVNGATLRLFFWTYWLFC